MYIFQVHHYIKPDKIDEYKAAVLENAQKSIKEPGVIRFDVFQDSTNPAHFSLFEVYEDMAARDAHLETDHFRRWTEVYLQTQDHSGVGDEFMALFPDESMWMKPKEKEVENVVTQKEPG